MNIRKNDTMTTTQTGTMYTPLDRRYLGRSRKMAGGMKGEQAYYLNPLKKIVFIVQYVLYVDTTVY